MKNIIKKIKKFYNDSILKLQKHELALKIGLTFILFLWVFNLSTSRFRKEHFDLKVGDIAPYDIKIKRDVEYIDYIKTENKRQEIIGKISSVFDFNLNILEEEKKKVDSFFDKVEQIDQEYETIDLKIAEARRQRLLKDKNLLKILFLNYKKNNFRFKAKNILNKIYQVGVTDLSFNDINVLSKTGNIIKIYNNERGDEISIKIKIKNLYYLKQINYFNTIKKIYDNLRWDKVQFLQVYIRRHIKPNIFYGKKKTDDKVVNAINIIKPVTEKLKKGQVIIRYGEEISESDFKILKEIVKYSSEEGSIRGYFIILLVLFALIVILLMIYSRTTFDNLKIYFFLLTFLFVFCIITYFSPNFNNFLKVKISNSFFVPIGGFAVLITQLVGYAVSSWMIVIMSILSMFLIGLNFVDFIVILMVGFFSLVVARKLKKRIYMWYLGFIIGVFYLILNPGVSGINNIDDAEFLNAILVGFLNGIFSVIISMGLYPLFENLFNILTEYKLIELSDLNLPTMKRLLIEAPGTYNHSILVANMAETASLAIGANSLLTRVGGYYHDVGKLENSEYFIENQMGDENKHENIKPSISVSIVKSHVKFGVEMAKKLKLPHEVVNIIQEHHGTNTISYFYKKALENDKVEKLSKNDLKHGYKYEGPKPTSKEAAIIMLADSVEAASRVLKKPSYSRLQTLVRELINTRFLDGQLDDCSLTLMDLNKIEVSFSHVLSAMFHTRIEYPNHGEIRKLENEY